jgi:hypothetical protein
MEGATMTLRSTLALWALLTTPATAAVFTVGGPNGQHATVQAAIDAALAAGGDNEVRVAKGVYAERLTLPHDADTTRLSIRGGWNSAFSQQTPDGANTVIDAANLGRALDASAGFELEIEGLLFRRGRATNDGAPNETGGGAGVRALVPSGTFKLSNCRIEDSTTAWEGSIAEGGGLNLAALGSSRVEVSDCVFEGNVARSIGADRAARGSALYAEALGTAELRLERLTLSDNRAESKDGTGGAFFLRSWGDSQATVADVKVAATRNKGNDGGPQGAVLFAFQNSRLDARRLHVTGTANSKAESGLQVEFGAVDSAQARLSDTLIAAPGRGVGSGLRAAASDQGVVRLLNLTVTGHDGVGIATRVEDAGVLSLVNSVLWNDGQDLAKFGVVKTAKNLVGENPRFVDAAARDYRLRPNSPAANRGANAPAGGLSALDLDRKPRVKSGKVDQGAYESQ